MSYSPNMFTGGGGGSGTVTSVALTMPTGFSVSGSPITGSGTLAVSTTLNGYIKGNGTGFTASATVATTDLSGTLQAAQFPALTGDVTTVAGALGATIAAGAGSLDRWREDFAYPIAASAQNTAVTIVCPATTSVIWRVTAGYYIAP